MSTAAFPTDEARLAAVRARDAAADGVFFFSVSTTGVYCYPSCAARPALRQNIAFHLTREDAVASGFRPCKRCHAALPPRGTRDAALIAKACRAIETAEEELSFTDLAVSANLSPHHFHRMFRRITGVTPKSYAAAHRQTRVQNHLTEGASVTAALYDAGFNSSGRFYESAGAMLGMTPSRYRAGGVGEQIQFATGDCSLGKILAATTQRGVCAILMGNDEDELRSDLHTRFPQAHLSPADSSFTTSLAKIIEMIDHPAQNKMMNLPLDIRGTAFQRRVWEILRTIPAGQTLSYSEVAQRLGTPKAVRAVAGACAANTLAVAIPCHRVIATSGKLAGYRWGIERKRELLKKESA